MAATLTNTGDLTFFSFPIEKTETTPDGDLVVYGKATDGSVDHDSQIVDPAFSSKAIGDWLSTGGNLRVQHNAQRDPAGIGLEAHTDEAGATWVKGLVIEPVAKKLVSKGALRAYSVGIANPTIERDITGKARGGIIKAGKIVEISLVDRPANPYCAFQLVKSMDDGLPGYVGKVIGSDDIVQKMLHDGEEDLTISFTPNDLAKILQNKIIEKHYSELADDAVLGKRDFDPGVGGGVDRDKLDESDFAGPHRSFPIVNQSDVSDALHLVGHADNPDAVRARIKEIAHRKGFHVPDDDDKSDKGVGNVAEAAADILDEAAKEAAPDITKKPFDPDHDGDNDATASGDTDHDFWAADGTQKKPVPGKPLKKKKKNKNAVAADEEKCMPSGTPQSASGAKDACPMDEMPDPGAYQETPMPAGRKAREAAIIRFKSIGMDINLGRLHDLTCPAYDPDDVVKYHPFADFKSVIDESVFQRMAVQAAAGQPVAQALKVQAIWQAAVTLKNADMADLNDFRAEMHKAFRDANPGPATYPSPGSICASQFTKPHMTAGHAAYGNGYDGPDSTPAVATSAPNAHDFARPPLSAGHQTPSPSFMKASFEYPAEQGVPVRLTYAVMEKERARQAILDMHEHISHMFPQSCPIACERDPHVQPASRPVPPIDGISKTETADQDVMVKTEDADLVKARKKMKKKLGKKILSGKMTVDEARAHLGRNVAQKAAVVDTVRPDEITKSITPDVMKTLMSDLLEPFRVRIEEQDKLLAEQKAVLEKIADQPDPATAPYAGYSIRKSMRPEGVVTKAEAAERTQAMIIRELDRTARTSENAAQREAAYAALARYQNLY